MLCSCCTQVTAAEGFGKTRLFEILDDLEEKTRPIMQEARQRLAKEKGESALEPHNMGYALAGTLAVCCACFTTAVVSANAFGVLLSHPLLVGRGLDAHARCSSCQGLPLFVCGKTIEADLAAVAAYADTLLLLP